MAAGTDQAEALRLLNTIYIISKGRPQCRTARTLSRMNYPGEWFIVCGTNDETLREYREAWGEHVLVFDFDEELKRTETLDGFGFEDMASGAVPVRNATRRISHERGELRHWQLDDDYTGFYGCDVPIMKNVRLTGEQLQRRMLMLAEYAHRCGMANCGFPPSTIEVEPKAWRTFDRRVFNAHNLPSETQEGTEVGTVWRSRMNDDLINAMDTWRRGGYEMTVRFMAMTMEQSQQEAGGLTELYREEGTVRKTAYAVVACPAAVKLVKKFGRYHHRVNWGRVTPKLLRESWRRV